MCIGKIKIYFRDEISSLGNQAAFSCVVSLKNHSHDLNSPALYPQGIIRIILYDVLEINETSSHGILRFYLERQQSCFYFAIKVDRTCKIKAEP